MYASYKVTRSLLLQIIWRFRYGFRGVHNHASWLMKLLFCPGPLSHGNM